MEHTIHFGACRFVVALSILAVQKAKWQIHGEEVDEYDEDLDVDTCLEVEASADNVEAVQAASVTDFDAGDVVGKLMAFISQQCLCSEDTRDYLKELTVSNGCPPWEIKLWVCSCWGSLSDCFRTVLAICKVRVSFSSYVSY